MKKALRIMFRVGLIATVSLAAGMLWRGGMREVRAEPSGCFRECDGLVCRFAASLTQCDEEDLPEAKICTNWACSVME